MVVNAALDYDPVLVAVYELALLENLSGGRTIFSQGARPRGETWNIDLGCHSLESGRELCVSAFRRICRGRDASYYRPAINGERHAIRHRIRAGRLTDICPAPFKYFRGSTYANVEISHSSPTMKIRIARAQSIGIRIHRPEALGEDAIYGSSRRSYYREL